MTAIIVSYDGTANDEDALALGRLLARGGATPELAYVRHSREYDPRREELAQHDAERRLEHGATWLGNAAIPRHVVVSASTGDGLGALAAQQDASVIVFGSDYRTPPGSVEPGTSAQHLLEGGSVAVAVAPAGLRTHPDRELGVIALADDSDDPAVQETATALAESLGATLADPSARGIGLIVVGSRASAADGRVGLSSAGRYLLETSRAPVLVLPRATPVRFDTP